MWVDYVFILLVTASGITSLLFYLQNQTLKTVPQEKGTLDATQVTCNTLEVDSVNANELTNVNSTSLTNVTTDTLKVGLGSVIDNEWLQSVLKPKNKAGSVTFASQAFDPGWNQVRGETSGSFIGVKGSKIFILDDGVYSVNARGESTNADFQIAVIMTDATGPPNTDTDTIHSSIVQKGKYISELILTPYGSKVQKMQGHEMHILVFSATAFTVTDFVCTVRKI
jgi:hypothetical protein